MCDVPSIVVFCSEFIIIIIIIINSEKHNINTRHTSNLNLPRAHLNIYQKGVYYLGIKIFNSLSWDIKTYSDISRTFKKVVKNLYTQTPFIH
jgi:hypothetical protein